MKLWIDDVRPAPEGYRWVKSVAEAKETILNYEIMYAASGGKKAYEIELISIAGGCDGCDRLFDWLEKTGRDYSTWLR